MAGDADFDKVALLLHFDGSNGSTAFTDSSGTPNALTAYDGAVISTAQSKFSEASAYFPGVYGNRILVPAGGHLNFGAGDFTIEAWIRPSTLGDNKSIISQYGHSGNRSWDILILGNVAHFRFTSNGESDVTSMSSPAVQAGVWSHVAVVRSGSNFYIFANGVLGETRTSTASIYPSAHTAAIGYNQEGVWPFYGHIDELRITKGAARYTANFTPPTEPFPNASVAYALSGTVTGSTGSPVARAIRAIREDTGAYVGGVISNATTGAYTIPTEYPGEHTVVAYPVTGENLPALVHHGVIPI